MECGNIVPITFLMTRIMDYRGAFIAKIVHMLIISIIAFVYIWRERSGKEFRDKKLLLLICYA